MFNQKPAICRICKEGCGLLVSRSSKGLRIVGNPEHPVSQGFACFRGTQFGHVHDSPERLTSPLLKVKSGWKVITHKDAVDILAEKIRRARDTHGAQSVCFYKGESLKHQESAAYLRHLCYGLGSPNYHSVGSICHSAMALGHGLTYGGIPAPDYSRVKSILVWGCNPASSFQRSFMRLKKAKERGTKIIVVDPSQTTTARIADVHLPVRPGSDGFLALAFLKHCTEQDRLVPDAASSIGWSQLQVELASMSLEVLLDHANIDMDKFLRVADMLVNNSPTWIQTGLGLELQPSGVQTVRAIACLQAVLDPLSRPATPWGKLRPLPGSDSYPQMPPPVGMAEFPVFTGKTVEGQAMQLPGAVLENTPYPVRTMLITGANPMMTFPDPMLFAKTLQGLDFLAVCDLFMTETARQADLVLPAATFLEFHELHDYVAVGQPYLGLVQPVEDSGKGWPLWKLVFELAKHMDLNELFPWQDNRQALTERMSGKGIEFHELTKSTSLTVKYEVPAVEPGVWRTSDNKVHFHSAELEKAGQPGIPTADCFLPPLETGETFPFYLSTGDRVPAYQHSQFHNIPQYRKQVPKPDLEMHPATAHALKIMEDETITLSTPFGNLDIAVSFSEELSEDCLRLGHGWSEANANMLATFDHLDPISGFPWLKAIPAGIVKKSAE